MFSSPLAVSLLRTGRTAGFVPPNNGRKERVLACRHDANRVTPRAGIAPDEMVACGVRDIQVAPAVVLLTFNLHRFSAPFRIGLFSLLRRLGRGHTPQLPADPANSAAARAHLPVTEKTHPALEPVRAPVSRSSPRRTSSPPCALWRRPAFVPSSSLGDYGRLPPAPRLLVRVVPPSRLSVSPLLLLAEDPTRARLSALLACLRFHNFLLPFVLAGASTPYSAAHFARPVAPAHYDRAVPPVRQKAQRPTTAEGACAFFQAGTHAARPVE